MRKTLIAVCLSAVIFTAVPALAGTQAPGVERRQCRQQRRIAQGVRRGQLTAREARRLERGQARVQRREARMKEDGELTRGERARLHRALRQQSRQIYRLRHNQ